MKLFPNKVNRRLDAMSETLARGMAKAFHQARKKNPYEVHASAILAMFSVAFAEQDEQDIINFLGNKEAAALFAESFDDAIIAAKKEKRLLPLKMEEARDRLMQIAGVHTNGRDGEICQLDDGSWAALIGDECSRCGYQRGDH